MCCFSNAGLWRHVPHTEHVYFPSLSLLPSLSPPSSSPSILAEASSLHDESAIKQQISDSPKWIMTMRGQKVQEDVSLRCLRRFFARDVNWNFALGRATCKPKITFRKRFLQVETQSAFSRLLFHLMNDAEEDEDADYLAAMSTLHQNSVKSSKTLSESSDTSGASEDEASCETD